MIQFKENHVGKAVHLIIDKYISRERLAEILELSPNFIGQVERGEKKMSLETLIKISDILDVSLDYFVKGYTASSDEKKRVDQQN